MTSSSDAVSKILQGALQKFRKLKERQQSHKASDSRRLRKAPSHQKPVGQSLRVEAGKKVKAASGDPQLRAQKRKSVEKRAPKAPTCGLESSALPEHKRSTRNSKISSCPGGSNLVERRHKRNQSPKVSALHPTNSTLLEAERTRSRSAQVSTSCPNKSVPPKCAQRKKRDSKVSESYPTSSALLDKQHDRISPTPPERGAAYDLPTPEACAARSRGKKRGASLGQDAIGELKMGHCSKKMRTSLREESAANAKQRTKQSNSDQQVCLLLSTSSRKALTACQQKHLKSIGAKILSEEDDAARATHVVVTDRTLRRTLRVMCAFCRGQKVMHIGWLFACLRVGCWTDEVEYELTPEARATENMLTNPSSGMQSGRLLEGRCVYVYPSVVDKEVLELIVTAAGGTLLRSRHHAGNVIQIGSIADRQTAENSVLFSPELLFEAAMSQQLREWAHKL